MSYTLKPTNYNAFLKLHIWSVALNIAAIVANAVVIFFCFKLK